MKNLDCSLFVILTVMLPIVYLFGYYSGAEVIRKQAITANVAKYYANEQTGETKFVFIAKSLEKLEK